MPNLENANNAQYYLKNVFKISGIFCGISFICTQAVKRTKFVTVLYILLPSVNPFTLQ